MTDQSSIPRVHFHPAEMEPPAFYRVLNSVVVPRPIAWVCTRSAEGVLNLAPHSFYTVACARPPIVQFTSVGAKDTLRNVVQTGEFVVNLAYGPLLEAVNNSSAAFPRAITPSLRRGRRPRTIGTAHTKPSGAVDRPK